MPERIALLEQNRLSDDSELVWGERSLQIVVAGLETFSNLSPEIAEQINDAPNILNCVIGVCPLETFPVGFDKQKVGLLAEALGQGYFCVEYRQGQVALVNVMAAKVIMDQNPEYFPKGESEQETFLRKRKSEYLARGRFVPKKDANVRHGLLSRYPKSSCKVYQSRITNPLTKWNPVSTVGNENLGYHFTAFTQEDVIFGNSVVHLLKTAREMVVSLS